ncbi:helix-turn-helix domain-containing protein [Shewanella baltica]|uniref:helix-turn-helix domain-containing protein n=1 Tax=Shewanella baltica TaxID=62322 RepID=UPI003CFC8F51
MNNLYEIITFYYTMLFVESSELIKLAMSRASLNQAGIAKKIGKSQAQVSKYLAGLSTPSQEVIIHIVNIISECEADDVKPLDIFIQIHQLDPESDHDLLTALMRMVKAYKVALNRAQ